MYCFLPYLQVHLLPIGLPVELRKHQLYTQELRLQGTQGRAVRPISN